MSITVNKNIIVEGSRVAYIKYHLVSNAAAEVTNQVLQAMEDLVPVPVKDFQIVKIQSAASDMDIDLHYDGTPDKDIITLPAGTDVSFDFSSFGGLPNTAEHSDPSFSGDLLFSTRGAAADSEATIILHLKKR